MPMMYASFVDLSLREAKRFVKKMRPSNGGLFYDSRMRARDAAVVDRLA